jgi:hypothetical protein
VIPLCLASPGCPDPPAVRFERPHVASPRTADGHMHSQLGCDVFLRSFPAASDARHSGHRVMLIAERTVSQVGYTGLFRRAENGTVLVGTPTSRANGDVTSLVLAAGIAVSFMGQAVLHPDGSPLQQGAGAERGGASHDCRSGSEGRDEVLEAVIAYIEGVVADG